MNGTRPGERPAPGIRTVPGHTPHPAPPAEHAPAQSRHIVRLPARRCTLYIFRFHRKFCLFYPLIYLMMKIILLEVLHHG